MIFRYNHLYDVLFLMILAIALAVGAICRLGYLLQASQVRENGILARSALNDLWISYLETETSLRGSVLTENVSHLDFYYVSIAHIKEARGRLEPFKSSMTKKEQADLQEINRLIDFRLKEMASIIERLHSKGWADARALIISIDGGIHETLTIRELKNEVEGALVSDLPGALN